MFTSNGKNHLVRGRLKDLEEQLPPNFIRLHRSYIVNRNFIKGYDAQSVFLLNGDIIPIGRTFRNKMDH